MLFVRKQRNRFTSSSLAATFTSFSIIDVLKVFIRILIYHVCPIMKISLKIYLITLDIVKFFFIKCKDLG